MNITSVKRIHQSDWMDSGIRFLRARDIFNRGFGFQVKRGGVGFDLPPEGLFLGDERVSPFQNRQRLRLGLFRFQGFLDLGRDEGVLALVHKVRG